jgi:hypothetical protein
MDTIEWIKLDLARAKKVPVVLRILFATIFFLIPIGVGLLSRKDLDDSLHAAILIPNLLAMVALGLAWLEVSRQNFSSRQAFRFALFLLPLALFFALDRLFFPGGPRTEYLLESRFEHETLQCFLFGGATTLGVGLYLTLVTFLTSSLLSRRARFFLSIASGMSGAVMLGFHCGSSSIAHVMWGHLFQGIAAGILIFGLQEIIFAIRLRRSHRTLVDTLKNPQNLG